MPPRSRLGRDPLRNAAQPSAKKAARPAAKGKASTKTPAIAPTDPAPVQTGQPADLTADAPPAAPLVLAPCPCRTPLATPASGAATAAPDAAAAPAASGGLPAEAETGKGTEAATENASTAVASQPPAPEAGLPASAPRLSDPGAMPLQGPHPVEGFLRGVLETLTPEGFVATTIGVDPETFAIPVEKLFFFSHALQLLMNAAQWPAQWPHQWPGRAFQRSDEAQSETPRLTVCLRSLNDGCNSLRLYDNGLFFSNYLSKITLKAEVLRPLLLYVTRRQGSLCLRQGRCVEFEIIG